MNTIDFRYIPKAERNEIPDEDFGYVKGERRLFPVQIADDVAAAAKLIGKAKGLSDDERDEVKKKLIKIAKKKNFDYPEAWKKKADMSEDLAEQLTENILFTAELEDIVELQVEDKLFTLVVTGIKTIAAETVATKEVN